MTDNKDVKCCLFLKTLKYDLNFRQSFLQKSSQTHQLFLLFLVYMISDKKGNMVIEQLTFTLYLYL